MTQEYNGIVCAGPVVYEVTVSCRHGHVISQRFCRECFARVRPDSHPGICGWCLDPRTIPGPVPAGALFLPHQCPVGSPVTVLIQRTAKT